MSALKITVLQETLNWMDGPANLHHFDGVLKGIEGRDIILLPEMFTTGFAMEGAESSLPDVTALAAMAINITTAVTVELFRRRVKFWPLESPLREHGSMRSCH
jgi:predicted amidohydrolase